MVKVNKIICLDAELIGKLKGHNASALINELLYNYFNNKDIKNMSEDELRKTIEMEEAKEEYQNKIRLINGN